MKNLNFYIHTLSWRIYSPKRNNLYHYFISIGFEPYNSFQYVKNMKEDVISFFLEK